MAWRALRNNLIHHGTPFSQKNYKPKRSSIAYHSVASLLHLQVNQSLSTRERERSFNPNILRLKILRSVAYPLILLFSFFFVYFFFSLSCVWVVPRINKIKILLPNTCWIHLYPYLFQIFVLAIFRHTCAT